MSNMNVVANNIQSMFSQRQLGITNKNKAKSTEKLSSGYRINRAADDAAGLTISEKMRFQIRGLNQGCNNIQDGISLIQTAEGALGEVHDMLHRMKELAVKGLNDTMTYEDRNACQEEINALYDDINRIADQTTFNEIAVLKGNPTMEHERSVERTRAVIDMQQMAPEMPSEFVTFGADFSCGGANITSQIEDGGKAIRTIYVSDEDVEEASKEHTLSTTPDGRYYFNASRSNWSESLEDNYGTTVDFSRLAATTGRTEVGEGAYVNNYYSALLKFVGTGFYTTCNSCDTQYNIVFTDNRGTYRFEADDAVDNSTPGANVQINIDDLLEKAQKEDLSAEDSEKITRELIERIATRGNNDRTVKGHFTRYAAGDKGSGNEFKLAIYDFRDYDSSITDIPTYKSDPETEINFTLPPDTDKNFGKTGNLQGTLYTYDVEVYVEGVKYKSKDPLNIQHGDGADFCSKINLPNLQSIFNIYQQHGYKSIKEALTIQENIPARDYRAAGTYTESTVEIPERTYERPIYETIPGTYHDTIYGENSEVIRKGYYDPPITRITGMETVTIPAKTVTKYEYNAGEQVHEDAHYGDVNRPILDVIDDLTNQVSAMRSDLGSQQNRLERALKQNRNVAENTQDAESRIRDTDIADEMVKNSKENILQQVGQSMLAQNNQSRQGILTLLQ